MKSPHGLSLPTPRSLLRPTFFALLAMLSTSSLLACEGKIYDAAYEAETEEKLGIAASGRWIIPQDVTALGDEQDVSYTGAGSWNGSGSCTGGMTDGALKIKQYLEANFPQVEYVGGYACRSIVGNSSKMSVHGTGRALDIHIPLTGGSADNQAGDPIGNWLIANAESIGIQYVIWDRTQWTAERADGTKGRKYNGQHPHNDHLHIELSVQGGQAATDWFSGPQTPPKIPSCESIPVAGGIVDNTSPCLRLAGASKYWRTEQGAGEGGSLLWTNAFLSSAPSNWAEWMLQLDQSGRYEVQVFIDPAFGQFSETQYKVVHGGQSTTTAVDQGQASGWTTLGVFDFAAGGGQTVTVYDHATFSPGEDRQVVVDAIRLRPSTAAPGTQDPGTPDPITPDPITPDPISQDPDGCSAISGTGSTTLDNDSLCLALNGSSQFWRNVDGAGFGGDLVWTKAFQSSTPSNWARWDLSFETTGAYEVEVYLDPSYAEFAYTEYRIDFADDSTVLDVNQGAGNGWTSIGVFDFGIGLNQGISVLDSTPSSPGLQSSIAIDAIRLTRRP